MKNLLTLCLLLTSGPIAFATEVAELEIIKLPVVTTTTLDDGKMSSANISFEIPNNAISFQIQAERQDTGIMFTQLQSSTGEVLIGKTLSKYKKLEEEKGSHPFTVAQISKLRVEMPAYPGIHSILVPNYTFDTFLPSGTYQAKVTSALKDPNEIKITLMIKIAKTKASFIAGKLNPRIWGRFPVRLILAPHPGDTQNQNIDALEKQAQSMLEPLKKQFAKLRLEPTFEILPAPRGEQKSLSEFTDKFGKRDALNVLFINYGTGESGRSMGKPGPVFNEDSHTGTVVIHLGNSKITESVDVIVHEAGHYLGLSHVCEDGINIEDELEDTKCVRSNPMYGRGGFGDFTTDQIGVVMKHPLVKLYLK